MAAFVVRVECDDVVERDLFARVDVFERHEEYVAVRDAHVGVGRATVIYVMRAVAAFASVQTPVGIDGADAQLAPTTRAPRHFTTRNPLARVLRDLTAFAKKDRRETSPPINPRRPDGETMRKLHKEAVSCQ